MALTPEQNLAATKSGTNIIVSAGAGSGKTTVLTQRVINKLKSGIHINELLILTFTNNAASEMKDRIKKAIEDDPSLSKELDLIDAASITTFDAYTLSLVKKYHTILNLDNDISIIDSSIIKKQKKEIIKEIFNNYYEQNDNNFIEFVSNYGTKNDKLVQKLILKLDNKLDLLTNKEEYLQNYINNYYNNDYLNYIWSKYEESIKLRLNTIQTLLYNLSFEVSSEYNEKINEILLPLLNAKNYEEIKSTKEIRLPNLTNTTDKGKYYKDNIKKTIDEIKNLSQYSKEVLINDYKNTEKYTKTITEILFELTNKINAYKLKYQLFEFNDISKFAIKLLKQNVKIKEELKNYYKEIMIDEYQDTSDIEEEFISLIENHNVYMVGDIKQSIYRFRNANPNIFKNKYDEYKENKNGYKIDLNKNFRSREEVLVSINNIFNHIMDNEIGNAEYKKEHNLIYGNKVFENEGNNNYNNNLEIYNYEINPEHTKEEIESFIIANDIKEKIKNKYQVLDGNELRLCKYEDFCILIDRTSAFDIYKKVFDYLKIPLNIYKDDDILLSDETYLIKNIIGLIINIKNNIFDENTKLYYASISRSYLFETSDDEIYKTINNIKDTKIYEICKEISKNIDYLSNKEIIEQIIDKFDFYQKIIKVDNPNYRTIILNNLIDKLNELNKVGENIYDVNEYLTSLINDKEQIKLSAIITKSDSVTITNIHKSKGLEYKICYFSGFHKEFNTMDIKDRILYSNDYGIIIPNYENGFKPTFIEYLNKEKYMQDEISEKIRLLYVALTRAKEKMIIVTSLKEDIITTYDENELVDYLTRKRYKSFLDILNSVTPWIKPYIKNINIPIINNNYKIVQELNNECILNSNIKLEVKETKYKFEKIEEEHYSKVSNKLITQNEKANMEYGNHMHYILENTNLKNPSYENLTNEEIDIIKSLLENKIMQNIKDANIYQEYEFIIETNNSIKTGVIDLILEYTDHIDIIDYKLKHTDDDAYLKQLNGYKEYIQNKKNKKVYIYLYSLLEKNLVNLN